FLKFSSWYIFSCTISENSHLVLFRRFERTRRYPTNENFNYFLIRNSFKFTNYPIYSSIVAAYFVAYFNGRNRLLLPIGHENLCIWSETIKIYSSSNFRFVFVEKSAIRSNITRCNK